MIGDQLSEFFVSEARRQYGGLAAKTYRDLRVWQSAMDLTEATYRFTDQLPREEQFGLVSQIRRASVSIPSNIAEGWGRDGDGDFQRFVSIATGSLRELETHLLICERLEFGASEDLQLLLESCDALGSSLFRLRQAINSKRSTQNSE